MFELTNEQRKCFALPIVEDNWQKIQVPSGSLDLFYTYAYLDGNRIRKIIQVYDEQPGYHMYKEYGIDELVSEDRTLILPKTSKGKPQKLSSASIGKRTPLGMSLAFDRGHICLLNWKSDIVYYANTYEKTDTDTLYEFSEWVNRWCAETTAQDLNELSAFSAQDRKHYKYREGDFFRFKLNRRMFGYGRIIFDYSKLERSGIPCWKIFMGKPLCVAVYHLITDNPNLMPEDLKDRMMLPSQMIMDNAFYYGEYTIIGNIPLTANEGDFTIHYGNTISSQEQGVRYQCGRTYIALNNQEELFPGFRHSEIGWGLNVKMPILKECIARQSNDPYWQKMPAWQVNGDLRNPRFVDKLHEVHKQVGIEQ